MTTIYFLQIFNVIFSFFGNLVQLVRFLELLFLSFSYKEVLISYTYTVSK